MEVIGKSKTTSVSGGSSYIGETEKNIVKKQNQASRNSRGRRQRKP